MTQRSSKYSKAWIGIAILFPVLYIALGSTGALIFHVNDDPAVISITKWSRDFHTEVVHSITGWIFMSLYSWKSDFFWYDLIIVLVYSAGISRFFILFSRYRKLSCEVSILLVSCILLGFLPFQPNFTFLSLMLSIVAIFPFLVGDIEEVLCLSLRNVIVSFLFLIGACLYRSLSAFMIVGCALGIHTLLASCEAIKKCPKSSLKNFWRRAGMLIGMACFALLMHLANIYSYTAFPDYSRYLQYDNYRRDFTDFHKYSYNSTFGELGISKNDFALMKSFKGIDSPPLHLENLKKLPSLPVGKIWRIRIGLKNALKSLNHMSSKILLAILLCSCLFSRRAQIISGVCLGSIAAIAIYTSRMNLRVCLPFLTLGAITCIFFLSSELKKHNLRRSKVDITFICVLVLILAVFLTGKFQYSKISHRIKMLESASPIWKFCNKKNIKSAAIWVQAIPGANKRLFFSGKRQRTTRLYSIGGWTGYLPKRLRKLKEIYGQDIYAGLAKPGTYHIFSRRQKALFETFVKEHGHGNAEPRALLETKFSVLYIIEDRTPIDG